MRSLSAISGHDAPWCGSKAAWLGELMARGYLVPPGVALSTETFNRFIARPELSGLIARSVEAAATAPPAELRSISDSVRDAFELQDLPAEVVNRLSNWLQKSPRATFAVRSSATNEDLPGATFAGQYDSFLNVPAPEIPRAIVRCFASLFSARAFLYRRRKGFTAPGEMAVIVQAMIHGQHAGVVFTRAPNRPAMLLMECVPGPAEGVVSGAIAPSRY
jgi:phosphoenolpyruvate synthase/pyruvate phosphate dikinase